MPQVLVVEDNPLVAKFYRLALERGGGYQVTSTEDVEEILRLIEASAIDVVILDVSLRNCRYEGRAIDGLELARLIRERTPGRKTPSCSPPPTPWKATASACSPPRAPTPTSKNPSATRRCSSPKSKP